MKKLTNQCSRMLKNNTEKNSTVGLKRNEVIGT
jgi:hypothetical protein